MWYMLMLLNISLHESTHDCDFTSTLLKLFHLSHNLNKCFQVYWIGQASWKNMPKRKESQQLSLLDMVQKRAKRYESIVPSEKYFLSMRLSCISCFPQQLGKYMCILHILTFFQYILDAEESPPLLVFCLVTLFQFLPYFMGYCIQNCYTFPRWRLMMEKQIKCISLWKHVPLSSVHPILKPHALPWLLLQQVLECRHPPVRLRSKPSLYAPIPWINFVGNEWNGH